MNNGYYPQTYTCPYCGETSNASVCPRPSCLEAAHMNHDPEAELRAIWTEKGIPPERQEEILASVTAAAQPEAMVGPFRIPSQAELFDTTEALPLFANAAVPATHTDQPDQRHRHDQPALFCFMCHQGGHLILARDGHRYCYSCARTLNRR